MNEKQTEEQINQEENTTSYSLDGPAEEILDTESGYQNSSVQKYGVLIIAVIVILIAGFFIIQIFFSGTISVADTPANTNVAIDTLSVPIQTVTHEIVGEYLAGAPSGLTLYTVTTEDCPEQCMKQWVPYTGNLEVNNSPISSELMAANNLYHYAWNGNLLYYYAQDVLPADFLGDGFFLVGSIARP